MEKPILVVMVGLPGSGKTTVANELVKNYGFKIFSSDDYRLKLLGDENNQDNNYYIFKRLKKDVRYNLKNGNNCIFDATNVTMGCRKRIFKGLNDIEFNAIAIVISTNIEECFKRNNLRERFVPEDDIRKFADKFKMPSEEEGFNMVLIDFNEKEKSMLENFIKNGKVVSKQCVFNEDITI